MEAMIHVIIITVVYFIAGEMFFIELIDGDGLCLLKVLLPGIDTYTQERRVEREREKHFSREQNNIHEALPTTRTQAHNYTYT